MRPLRSTFALLVIAACLSGCGKGWQMDYGKPAAQFEADELVSKGQDVIGQKITVKGTLAKVDVTGQGDAWIHLQNGIRCNLGTFHAMAKGSTVGDTVYVDGFLKQLKAGDTLIEPAMLRDPTAPFEPR